MTRVITPEQLLAGWNPGRPPDDPGGPRDGDGDPCCGGPPPLPPLAAQAASAAGALARVAGALLSGASPLGEDAATAARLGVCRGGCDRYRPDDGRCGECGCFIAFKARLATEDCPLGRWPAPPSQPPGEPRRQQ